MAAFAPPAGAAPKAFENGVAAGEITATSAKLWGQATKKGKVTAEVAEDQEFEDLEAEKRATAEPSNDLTVQATVEGLKSGEHYLYRFCHGNQCSETGQFDTAPNAGEDETIRFAYTGDTDGTVAPGATQPFFGTFDAFAAMVAEKNDFNVHLGDTIYSDSGVAGATDALTVEQKWAKYAENLQQPNLQAIRGSAGFYSHWDDHEFINDFSIPEDGQAIYDAGVKAFTDYAPVTYSSDSGLYRSFRWGANAELFFLDERSFRSAKAAESCINPQTGAPDLAPTAPQSVRNIFALLIPSLSESVSQQCKDAINDPGRTMLGQAQLNTFLNDVQASNARFKIVVNETPTQQFYGLPYDRWEGYAHERIELLNQLEQRGVENVVFLTTDTHAAFANVIRYRTLDGDVAPANVPAGNPPLDSPFQDFIIGPVATNPFWDEIDAVTGIQGSGELLSNLFFKPPPSATPIPGVGMFCAQGGVFSYAEVEVSSGAVTIFYKDQNGNTVQDVNGQPCGPYTIPFVP
jgi:phosphodiesterase/alkaline phosphatase D-like protein